MLRDVTKDKRAEEMLKESEERFRSLVQNSSDIITVISADGTIVYQTPSMKRILGHNPEDRIGKNIFTSTLIHPDDAAKQKGLIDQAIQNPALEPVFEVRLRHRDGSWRWVEGIISNLLDDRNVGGIVLNSRNITERKKAEKELYALRREYEELISSVEAIIWKGEAQTLRFTFVSDQAETILGYPAQRWTEEHSFWPDHIHPEDREWALSFCHKAVAEKKNHDFEYRMISADGDVVWLRDIVRVGVEDGVPTQLFGVMVDITERKEAEEAVRKSETRLVETQRLAHLGGWEWEVGTDEVFWSDEVYRIYGFVPGAVVPTLEKLMEVVHPDDRGLLQASIDAALHDYEPYDLEHRVVRPNGEVRVVHRQAEVVRGEGDEPLRMIGTVHDITERKQAEKRLEYQTLHDPLTDLPNRKLFMDRLKQALRHTKRRAGHKKIAVLFMDLDNFKAVNDSLGHEIGDRLLVAAGERIRGSLRPEDTLARFGGDEFTVLVENVENPADAVRIVERIMEAHREPFVLEGQELFIKPSIGISLGEARTKSSEDLLRDADTAMYRAKKEGVGYQVFEPVMYEQALRRLKVENDLQRAIESEEFVVHYQPIIDLRSDEEVWGVEALVRWQHPERGLLDPKEFVPAAEESGLVIPMGEQVLEKACKQAKEWQERYPHVPPWVISVNLSARQIGRPDLARTIERILRETGLEAPSLSLDITETGYIKALEGNTAALDELKRRGVRLSIDDFGTGYSSLSYLKRLPVDALKIDRSFIRGLGEDVEDTLIVQMIIDLAHTLGMEVVAEGIESKGQAVQLKEMGCDLGQGYHFAKPLPPEAIPNFLTR